jgi:predicted lipid-binding transport protein (Tim44 family)
MRKSIQTLIVVAIAAGAVCGCANTYDPGQRALGGAAIGAGAGALLGGVAGGGNGALAGALIGGAVGAVGGVATTPEQPQQRYEQQHYEQPQGQYRY